MKKNKSINEMNVDDLKETLENLSKRKNNLNMEVKKLNNRLSVLKKNIKEIEKEKDIINLILELKENKEEKISKNKIVDEFINEDVILYLYFNTLDYINYTIFAVNNNKKLCMENEVVINNKYKNTSLPVKELYCFIDFLKFINKIMQSDEDKNFQIKKIYTDNIYIVNNWSKGDVKDHHNESLKELIPIATSVREEFEKLKGELAYVKPKNNIAKIYYKEQEEL